MRRVFVPNRSHHDFSSAERYGKLVFLTEGYLNRFNINHIFRMCSQAMADAEADDYLLVSSLSVVVAAASAIMADRFGRVNYLIWDRERRIYQSQEVLVKSYR